ncbi:MAG: J domain-containing protein [Candidatus Aenigmarchaeota archaeon]|nr:J domain-containing protein [Candidatus Aenigmarchaeota archaeon]
MMYGDAYMTEGYGDEKIQLFLEQDSTLRLRYNFSDKYSSFLTVPYIELNALTECIDPEIFRPLGDGHNLISIDEYRSRSIIDLIGELITELDLRGDAMKIANVRHNRASFTIEKDILDLLKGKRPGRQHGNETIDVDNVQKTHSGNNGHNRDQENFKYWLESNNLLLSKFHDVFIDNFELFAVLGISPTGDKAAVKEAYYEIVKKTHEAKIFHLSQEEQEAARERFKESAKAYNNIISCIDNKSLDSTSSICNLGRISQLFKEENF